ncbi:hypothetical protein [Pseudomonas sp. Z3-8]|uniref:hypothetical protein n=1 Tax=Pseudomonas sp. Z3-8 TaxID=2817412 RepID=UPI003DA8B974
MDDLLALLTDKRFMPHGHCYLWRPDLLWTNVIADSLITLSYVSIPFTLIYFINKRKDVPFDWMLTAFGVFILACGTSHVMEILTIWQPYYWFVRPGESDHCHCLCDHRHPVDPAGARCLEDSQSATAGQGQR